MYVSKYNSCRQTTHRLLEIYIKVVEVLTSRKVPLFYKIGYTSLLRNCNDTSVFLCVSAVLRFYCDLMEPNYELSEKIP